MFRAIVIDDEPLAAGVVQEFLASNADFEIVDVQHNGFDGVKAIEKHKPDVVFLDVQMPKINGFEMLELLDEKPAVIFTTAFEEYAVKAFEANAVDYLLKPISPDRFQAAIDKFRSKSGQSSQIASLLDQTKFDRLVLRDEGRIRIVPLHDVKFMNADDDYVKIVTTDKNYLKKTTLTSYESKLPAESFCRVHRSYLVNIEFITRIDPYEKNGHRAILKTGEKIPVSGSGYQRLKQVLGI